MPDIPRPDRRTRKARNIKETQRLSCTWKVVMMW